MAVTTISFIHTVAAFSGYGFEHGRYDAKLRDAKAQGVHHAKAMALFMKSFGPLVHGIFSFGFSVGSFSMIDFYEYECWGAVTKEIDACFNCGKMMSVLYGIWTGAFGISLAMQQMGFLMQSSAAACRICQIIDEPPRFDLEAGELAPEISGAIEFQGVVFSYPRPVSKAVDGASYSIPARSGAAFMRPRGSCKSTYITLLMRYYDPQEGGITKIGLDLRTLQLRSRFAVVQQEPILFAGTILFNIQCGKESATRQRPSRP